LALTEIEMEDRNNPLVSTFAQCLSGEKNMKHVRTGIALLNIFSFVGCSTSLTTLQKQGVNGFSDSVSSSVSNADLSPRFPTAVDNGGGGQNSSSAPMLFPGATPDTAAPAPGEPALEQRAALGEPETDIPASDRPSDRRVASAEPVTLRGDGVEMNFEGTDIASAAKALLGDILHLNFEIDPKVQGSVTLASVGPIPRKDVLPTFEDVLRMQNAAIVHSGNFLKIVPLNDAAAHASVSVGAGGPGFGVSVVPLRYVSAATVASTAQNLLGQAAMVRVDKARNLLLVRGTASERQAAIDMISTFDVEWLRNQSVGVYPLKSTSPDSMIQELGQVFEASNGGPGEGVIQFQPIARLNAVMVVTKNPIYLKEATRWVQRLDRSDTSGTTVRTYRLRYGNAEQVAKVLEQMFGGEQSGAAGNGPLDQIAPKNGTTESRIDSLDHGGQNSTLTTQPGGTTNAAGTPAAPIAAAFDAFSGHKDAAANGTHNAPGITAGAGSHGVLKNVRITADSVNNEILVYSSQEDYKVVERTLRGLDRPRLEVAIDATVAEVTLTNQLQYGVQYFLANQGGSVGLFQAAAQTATQAATSTALQQVAPGFNLLLGSQSNPKAILSALSSVTDVKVLSSPSIVAMDNEPALLQVGDEVPITTGTATILSNSNTPVVNTIQLFNTGVILKVLPHVNSNGTVELEVDQEVSSVVNNNNQATLTPTISERRIHSTVAVTSGQTVLLGGLISDNVQNSHGGIPGLSDINILGGLFGAVNNSRTRTEIIVFIKPRLIKNSLDFRTVTEEFREKLDSMRTTHSVIKGEGAELTFPNTQTR
jgi:general secretion pathway protein D